MGQLAYSSPLPSTFCANAVGSSSVCPRIKSGGLFMHTRWVITLVESYIRGWGWRWREAEPELTWNFQIHSKEGERKENHWNSVCRMNSGVGHPEMRVPTQDTPGVVSVLDKVQQLTELRGTQTLNKSYLYTLQIFPAWSSSQIIKAVFYIQNLKSLTLKEVLIWFDEIHSNHPVWLRRSTININSNSKR